MLECSIASPLDRYDTGELEGIFVRTVTGERGLLRGHIRIVAQLRDNSLVRLKTLAGGEIVVRIGRNSFFQFKDNRGIVLTSEFKMEAGPLASRAAAG
jgi:F0F1-type ATP synthase epsilon subunit